MLLSLVLLAVLISAKSALANPACAVCTVAIGLIKKIGISNGATR